MSQLVSMSVGTDQSKRNITCLLDRTAQAGTGVFWLGGFMSDMEGSKATAMVHWALQRGCDAVRFDYSGHGKSGGEFVDGTISLWLEEAVHVFNEFCNQPQIIVGSSMGGWLSLLLARYLIQQGRSELIKALVLIAPATDMTHDLMWDKADETWRRELMESGRVLEETDYGDQPYIITRDLIEDGKNHLLFPAPLQLSCPVHIIQGTKDDAVPWQHAFKLMNHLNCDNVTMTLIRGGDHRLSDPASLSILSSQLDLAHAAQKQ